MKEISMDLLSSQRGAIEFDLEDRDARESMKNALRADEMRLAIREYYVQVFRPLIKHGLWGEKELPQEQLELVQFLWEETKEHFGDLLDE